MPRTTGAKNKNFNIKRDAMIDAAIQHGLSAFPEFTSMRSTAAYAEVSLTNFRHYFPTENDLRRSVIEHLTHRHLKRAKRYQVNNRMSPRNGLCGLLQLFYSDWRLGLGKEWALSTRYAALIDDAESRQTLLRPYLDVFAECLGEYMNRRQIRKGEPEQAALMLLAPALFRLQAQTWKEGDDPWVDLHVSAFLKGWW